MIFKFNFENNQAFSFSLSFFFHLVFFVSAFIFFRIQHNPVINPAYINLNFTSRLNYKDGIEDNLAAVKKNEMNEGKDDRKRQKNENNYAFINSSSIIKNADTSNLKQIYSESTLNVSLRYPNGWTYIDQDVKDKLDGVTFWMASGTINPPPYVHLEVRDKDLFNQSKYKYRNNLGKFVIYFNDPEELEEQVSQEVYLKTNSDEDFSIKLIIKGKENFKLFQPEFFGMIKSFKLNNYYF